MTVEDNKCLVLMESVSQFINENVHYQNED